MLDFGFHFRFAAWPFKAPLPTPISNLIGERHET